MRIPLASKAWLYPAFVGIACIAGLVVLGWSVPHVATKSEARIDMYQIVIGLALFFGASASFGASVGAMFKAPQLECALWGVLVSPALYIIVVLVLSS